MESTVAEIINTIVGTYGPKLWLAFVTMVITGFVLTLIRNFITDVVYYFRARMSDIGYGQKIYWYNELYIVEKVHFKYITVKNSKKLVRIPIKSYITRATEFPIQNIDDTTNDDEE